MAEDINFWSDLEGRCPLKISRLIKYSKDFESAIPSKIDTNFNKMKESLFSARSYLDSMITSVIQMLYDRDILKKEEDKVLYAWLIDNLARFMKRLDENEEHLLIKFDETKEEESRVGVSRLSAYHKMLRTTANSLIFESFVKATDEYLNFKESESIKREPRTFLYILFQILQVTMAVLGSVVRERTIGPKKAVIQTIPTSWQSLMGTQGQGIIGEGYKEDTGMDLEKIKESIPSDEDLFEEGENV